MVGFGWKKQKNKQNSYSKFGKDKDNYYISVRISLIKTIYKMITIMW